MAHIAIMSNDFSTGAVAGETFIEGSAVELHASGVRNELPVAMLAASGSRNLFIALVPPDTYPRPTPVDLFTAPWYQTIDPRDAEEFLIDTGQRGPYYNIGPSMLLEPTIASGWLVQCHRGAVYALTANNFVDSTNIRVPGATVAWNGTKFIYSASNVCGSVREYRTVNGTARLYLKLDDRSA